MRSTLLALFLTLPCFVFSQSLSMDNGSDAGKFSLGARNTLSLFGEHSSTGIGMGGQFRIQLAERVNTQWFADFIRSDVEGLANRKDYHIGWSVMFYPWIEGKCVKQVIKPYIAAGHCFDYTKVAQNEAPGNFAERWSSAVQAGAGFHVPVAKNLDFTLLSQYMMHLGNDIHVGVDEDQLHIEQSKGTDLEGHLLLTLGVNYTIADLW